MSEQVGYQAIADRYSRSRSTVVNVWAKHPDWPRSTGKDGRTMLFDADAVEAFARAHYLPEEPETVYARDDLVTLTEAAHALGLSVSTLTGYKARGQWPVRTYRRGGTELLVWGEVLDWRAGRRYVEHGRDDR